ncbi:MAG: hypothetical protein ACI9DQ_000286 [Glaciecola sp.]|jgi:hypothetical protein
MTPVIDFTFSVNKDINFLPKGAINDSISAHM